MIINLPMGKFQRMSRADLETLAEPIIITRDDKPFFAVIPIDLLGQLQLGNQPKIYRPGMTVKPGDKVLIPKGSKLEEVKVPELDADGQPMPEY